MTRAACLIFNPISGSSDPDADLSAIQEQLADQIELEIQCTTPEIGSGELARRAVERGVKSIIVSGGDGTISSVGGALIGTGIPMGIISRGTANAIASALNIPVDIQQACQTFLDGRTRAIDVARANGKLTILLAGVGIEAGMVEQADEGQQKERLGAIAYILSGMQQLRQLQSFSATLETEAKIIQLTAAAITVANTAPPTSVLAQGPAGVDDDDGLLDITIFAPQHSRGAIAAIYHLLQSAIRGDRARREDIGYLRARRVCITTDPPQTLAIDGEIEGTTPLSVECIPQGLQVFVPPDESDEHPEKLEGLPDLEVKPK